MSLALVGKLTQYHTCLQCFVVTSCNTSDFNQKCQVHVTKMTQSLLQVKHQKFSFPCVFISTNYYQYNLSIRTISLFHSSKFHFPKIFTFSTYKTCIKLRGFDDESKSVPKLMLGMHQMQLHSKLYD